MKILFLYTGGRGKRIENSGKPYAKDFFYGYHDFNELGYEVDFCERIIPHNYRPRNLRYQWLEFQNKWAASKISMGNNAPFFLPHLDKIKQADVIIAIGDSISLAPEYFKLRKWIKGKIIHVSMGLANYWKEFLDKDSRPNFHVKWYYNRLLKHADSIVTLGEAETELMKTFFPSQRDKIKFVPFGIDIDFWQDQKIDTKENDVLFVGNDLRRDYDMLLKIAEMLPKYSFVFVTKHIKQADIHSNVRLYNGTWSDDGLTDVEIRHLYNTSRILINPIKPTLQPSGQSVTLQAMSCGLPVLISNFEGFWEPHRYVETSIEFIEHNLEEWVERIDLLLTDSRKRFEMSKNGMELTHAHYSSTKMTNKYMEIIDEL